MLAAAPRPATLGGVRLLPAGRLGPAGALLLVREAAAMAAPVPADAVWDGRFRLLGAAPVGSTLGGLGSDAVAVRGRRLPDAVARSLPALRIAGKLFAVPHLGYPDPGVCAYARVAFAPSSPVSGAGFLSGAVAAAKMDAP
jgi:tRNA(Ile)-lysidine synthase